MTDIINLRQKRKAKARDEEDKKASENRVKFGRTKAEKELTKAQKALAEKSIKGHELQDE